MNSAVKSVVKSARCNCRQGMFRAGDRSYNNTMKATRSTYIQPHESAGERAMSRIVMEVWSVLLAVGALWVVPSPLGSRAVRTTRYVETGSDTRAW